MWMVVMFDLPVMEKAERKAATQFRNGLLDLGFEMSQFSVYMRFCTSQAQVDTLCRAVERALPQGGKVNIFQFTWVFRTNVTAGFGIVTEDFGPS